MSTPARMPAGAVTPIRRRLAWRPALALAAVMAVFAVLATIVAVATPAWESADEPAHTHNVETLASGSWYRIPEDASIASFGHVRQELHQPPLYYGVLAGWQRLIGDEPFEVRQGPSAWPYVDRGVWWEHSTAQRNALLPLRLFNVLLGLLTVALTFLAVRALGTDRWTPVVAAATVAFCPRFVFLSAFVTNDNLANLLGAGLAYCAVRCVRAPSLPAAAALGAVVGALVITKLSALPAAVVLLAVVLSVPTWRRRAEMVGVAAAAALVVCGWFLADNTIRYGDPLARAASDHYLQVTGGLGTFGTPYEVEDPLRLVLLDVPERILRGHWYTSGWNQFRWPLGVNLLFWAVLAAALVGLALRVRARQLAASAGRGVLALAVLAAGAFLGVWIVAFNTSTYEARLALVGLPALAALAAVGVERWRLAFRLLLPALCLCGTLFAIYDDVLAVDWY